MKRNPFRLLVRRQDGTTLLEAICGLAILTLILGAMYAGFLTARQVFGEGDQREQDGQSAFSLLEQGYVQTQSAETITLSLGSGTVTFRGSYIQSDRIENGVTLYQYETGTVANFADGVRNTYIYWKLLFNDMTREERVQAGYPAWPDNSSIRNNWLLPSIYGGSWPVLPQEFLERYQIPVRTLYVQPYNTPKPVDDVLLNCFVFAGSSMGDNWSNTYLIYDHEERIWYVRKDNKTVGVANKTWAEVKAMIHTDEWRRLV